MRLRTELERISDALGGDFVIFHPAIRLEMRPPR